jgi:hypothetical protein
MLLPQRTIVEGLVDCSAVVEVVESPDPGKAGPILALEELAEYERAELLESFGKIALEIMREMVSFCFLNGVAT